MEFYLFSTIGAMMFNAKRDGDVDGACNAIPSMGVIEGRITVLEVIAMTSLGMVLKDGDKHMAQHVLSVIRRAMREKCEDMKLSEEDSGSAIAYAQELICASLENLDCSQSLVDEAAAAV
jgi:3-hydroxyacyl-CoA dehydrogenase